MATHAIVIGGSVAGLFAARVLADHFDRVTILDRDWTPDCAEPRRGVPQGRHAHALLASGLRLIERFYPGFSAEAARGGAIFGDMVGMLRWYQFGGYKARFDSGLDGILMSRPLLESIVRRHTFAIPNVARVERAHVVGLVARKDEVTGVLVEDADARGAPRALEGDLVVDASGRGSAGPAWLRALGYQAPPEELVEIGIGYASRMYRRGATDLDGDGGAVISPHPPGERRLGLMLAVEHDRWAVAIGGFDDHAPSDEAGYLAFAKSLPRPDIYDVIRHAEPLTDIAVHKVPSNRRVHYEKARLPGGYVTVGDAACSFNPMYAQGMTVAALEAEALQRELVRWSGNSRRSGFARAFYEQASHVIDVPWSMAVQEDLRYPR